jgi:hypothetical protein
MEQKSIRVFGEVSTEENLHLLKKALPSKSIIINFDGNPFLKEFLLHFYTANNFESVKEFIYKLIEYRTDEMQTGPTTEDSYTDPNFYTKKSFFISAIIMYSKCFNSPKGRVKRLDIKHLLKKLSNDLTLDDRNIPTRLLTIHQKIIMIRNKYVAHVEDSEFETVRAYLTLNMNGRILKHSLNGIYLGTYNFDSEEMQDWILLTSFLIKHLNEKQNELAGLFFNSISRDDLLRLAAEAGAFENNRSFDTQ